jgi:plastocyanin
MDPDVGVTADGSSIYLSWYDTGQQDLLLGLYGATDGLVLAQPSPTPSAAPTSSASGAAGACPKDAIVVTAPPGAAGTGFAEAKVTASASAKTLCLDNQDPTAGSPHNVDVLDKQGGTSLAKTTITQGPAIETSALASLKPGDYYFQCDVHPTTMSGTLTIK